MTWDKQQNMIEDRPQNPDQAKADLKDTALAPLYLLCHQALETPSNYAGDQASTHYFGTIEIDEHTTKTKWNVTEDAYVIQYVSRWKTFEQISNMFKDKWYIHSLNACCMRAKLSEKTH